LFNLDPKRIVLVKDGSCYRYYIFPEEKEGGGKKTRRRRLPKKQNTLRYTIALRRR
jgi:hypothetical protein